MCENSKFGLWFFLSFKTSPLSKHLCPTCLSQQNDNPIETALVGVHSVSKSCLWAILDQRVKTIWNVGDSRGKQSDTHYSKYAIDLGLPRSKTKKGRKQRIQRKQRRAESYHLIRRRSLTELALASTQRMRRMYAYVCVCAHAHGPMHACACACMFMRMCVCTWF